MSKLSLKSFRNSFFKAVSTGALLTATLGASQAWGVDVSLNETAQHRLWFGGSCLIDFGDVTGTIDDENGEDEFIYVINDLSDDGVRETLQKVAVGSTFEISLSLPSNWPVPITLQVYESSGGAKSNLQSSVTYSGSELSNCQFSNVGNTAPIANAGPDQLNVATGSTVTLDGTGSSDADGDTLTYQWTQVSGPSVTLSDATAASPSFTAPLTTDPLVFQLIVNDGTEDSVADTVEITTVLNPSRLDISYNMADLFNFPNGIKFNAQTCLPEPGNLSARIVTNGSTDDGSGRDNFIIEWYDSNGSLTGTDMGSVPLGEVAGNADFTNPASIFVSGADLVPVSGTLNFASSSYFFFRNPHTYRLYDADSAFNKIGTPIIKSPNIDGGTSAWANCTPSANTAPIANAGPDQTTLTVGSTVTLDGTGSSDADGDTLTYQWTQVSGPSVTLSDATAAMPSFTMPAGGVSTPIVFSLVVNDGTEESAADEVTLQAVPTNTAPVADAGPDQTTLRPNDTVTLDGSGSSDADGDTLTYLWTQVSGPAVTLSDARAVNPTFTIPLDAVATPIFFELVVNDGTEDSAPDQVTFQAVNDAPVANAGPDQTDPRPNDVVTLDGTGSSDPDGDNLTYMWTQVSGPTVTLDDATSATPTFTIPVDAVATAIVFELVVNDGYVDSAADQVSIMAQNDAPVADAGADQDDPRPNSVVTLDGSGSSDPDGDNLTYLWTQVSGPAVTLDDPTAVSPTFTIPVEAVTTPIVFQLVVNDGFVDSTPDTVTIMAQNEAPVAEAGVDQNDVIPGNTINLDGTGSTDADGDPLTFMWTQVSGTPVTLNDPTSATPTFEAPGGGGALVFQLVVNDGFVDSAPDMVTITVQDNVAVTTKAIGDFLAARNALILSHQPDLQRRIDRLQGRGGQKQVSTVNGAPIPGTQNLPIMLAMNGDNTRLAGSLSALNGQSKGEKAGKFDIWGEAYISSFNIDQRSGNFGIYYLGGDYLVSDNLLVGVLGQIDNIDYDDTFQVGVLDGEGWMAGPYVTAQLADNLYADGRITYGKSDNMISPFGTYVDSFETSRYLFAGSLTGEFDLSKTFTLRPEGGITYLTEDQDSYVDALGSTIPSQSSEQGQFHLAPRLHYNYVSDSGFSFRPFFEVEGIYSFGDGIDTVIGDDTRLRLEGGADIFTGGGLRLSGSYFKDGIGADGYDADGFRLSGGFTF